MPSFQGPNDNQDEQNIKAEKSDMHDKGRGSAQLDLSVTNSVIHRAHTHADTILSHPPTHHHPSYPKLLTDCFLDDSDER